MSTMTQQQAIEIKSRFEPPVLQMPGVTGVDVGERDSGSGIGPVIRVYVQNLAAAPALPKSVEGVPIEIIERSFNLQRP